MKTYYIGEITWLPYVKNVSGRKAPPAERTRWDPQIIRDPEALWSVDMICPDFSKTNRVIFWMFSPDAPTERICVSETYGLYDGPIEVAKVLILGKLVL